MAFLMIGTVFSQGIHFEHGRFEEILEKAKKENKLIFMDVYMSWCGPCKRMTKNVFPLKEVGDYYNKKFISYKVDAEKGEGREIARRYAVGAFPTLLYVSADGQLLHRSSGYATQEKLFELAEITIDTEKRFGPLEKEFNEGNRNKEFVLRYFNALRKAGGSPDPKLGIYLSEMSKEKLLGKEVYDLIIRYGRDIRGKVFEILIDNFEAFSKIGNEKELIYKISKRYLLSHSHHVGASFAEKYVDPSVITFLQSTKYPYKERLIERMKINYLNNCQKTKEVFQRVFAYLEKYGPDNLTVVLECLNKYAYLC